MFKKGFTKTGLTKNGIQNFQKRFHEKKDSQKICSGLFFSVYILAVFKQVPERSVGVKNARFNSKI